MKPRVTCIVVALSTLSLIGCRGDAPGGGVVIDTIGGVPSVMNPAAGIAGDTLGWQLSQYILVAGDQLFDRRQALFALDVGIGPNGDVFVLDAGNQRVLRFDGGGVYLGSFGRAGTGPGEFRAPVIMEVADSFVYVLDPGLNRVTAFDTSGIFIGRFEIDLGGLVGTSGVFKAGGANELYVAGEPAPFVPEAQDTGLAILFRLSRYGEIADTVVAFSPPTWTPVPLPDGGASFVRPRFAPEPYVSAVPGAVAIATSARYFVEIRSPDGSLQKRVARQYENAAVTQSIRDSIVTVLAEAGVAQQALDAMPFAPVIQAIEGLVMDDRGRLWVDPYIEGEPLRRDVYNGEGHLLGALYLPEPMQIEDVQGDRLCGVMAQLTGQAAAVCYRIEESSE